MTLAVVIGMFPCFFFHIKAKNPDQISLRFRQWTKNIQPASGLGTTARVWAKRGKSDFLLNSCKSTIPLFLVKRGKGSKEKETFGTRIFQGFFLFIKQKNVKLSKTPFSVVNRSPFFCRSLLFFYYLQREKIEKIF